MLNPNTNVGWVFLEIGLKCESKVHIISYGPSLGEGHCLDCSWQLMLRDFAKKVIDN